MRSEHQTPPDPVVAGEIRLVYSLAYSIKKQGFIKENQTNSRYSECNRSISSAVCFLFTSIACKEVKANISAKWSYKELALDWQLWLWEEARQCTYGFTFILQLIPRLLVAFNLSSNVLTCRKQKKGHLALSTRRRTLTFYPQDIQTTVMLIRAIKFLLQYWNSNGFTLTLLKNMQKKRRSSLDAWYIIDIVSDYRALSWESGGHDIFLALLFLQTPKAGSTKL